MLLRHHLKTLRLPTMLSEYAKLGREAAEKDEDYESYLLKLSELEVNQRGANAITARIKNASFPVLKDLETFDFTLTPQINKQKVLELARCEWVEHKSNLCCVGNSGTGKTHIAIALGQAACRAGKRVRFFTAQALVNHLEEAQKNYRLERMLSNLNRIELLIVDELGYISFSRSGAELLFQVFADRYERESILITSNLPFGEWGSIFQGDRMTAALLDRLTHRCTIFEMNGESYRFRESVKSAKPAKEKQPQES
ncbi:MAG: IS21-like element helper ATPase IstB [Ilumatobacteraceae bacterium]|nr:IS21-like element helper ATPase IstB [Ilumatobacteraceae bacterium]